AGAPDAGRGTDPYLTTGALGYDVLHYDVSLSYDARTHGLSAATTQVVAAATTTLSSFTLDMGQPLTISSVAVNGLAAHYSHVSGKLGVSPAHALPARKQFRVVVTYRGTPGNHADTSLRGPVGWEKTRGGAVTYAEPDGTHEFMPSKDVLYDKATWTVRLTTPRGLLGVSTGRYAGLVQTATTNTTTWDQAAPITPYQQMIAIDRFSTSTTSINKIRSFVAVTPVRASNVSPPTVDVMRHRTSVALTWLTARLGPFPYSDTGAIVVSGGDSAMETADRPTYSDDSGYDFSDSVVVHELAHEWFGGRLTAQNTADLWIHEAFATWLERYWQSQQPGGEPFAPHLRRNYLADGLDDKRAGQFGKVSVQDPTNTYRLESTVYYRGAMAVEALRQQVGAVAFGKVLRALGQQPPGHAFTTSRVVAIAQQVSGQDLTAWRGTWLASTGAQQPPVHATAQQTADELAREIGFFVYENTPGALTPTGLANDIATVKAANPTNLPLELITVGSTQSATAGSTTVTRAQLDVPAGLYGPAVHACLTFPTDIANDGDPGAWFDVHTPLSATPDPDTVTLSACP
ncbi:MAG: hypothetical protein JWO22_3004, partial [Frankiales bacterium]|nr:hypothetical protein [Frankiales bacterium]